VWGWNGGCVSRRGAEGVGGRVGVCDGSWGPQQRPAGARPPPTCTSLSCIAAPSTVAERSEPPRPSVVTARVNLPLARNPVTMGTSRGAPGAMVREVRTWGGQGGRGGSDARQQRCCCFCFCSYFCCCSGLPALCRCAQGHPPLNNPPPWAASPRRRSRRCQSRRWW
jgi:hypothetical protein